MSDPVAEHIGTLEHNNRNLVAQLAQCQRERTQSAEYAVNLEDQVHLLIEERETLILGLNHLYQHLTAYPDNPFTQEMCNTAHRILKEYVK